MKDQLTFWQVVRMLRDVDGWEHVCVGLFRYKATDYFAHIYWKRPHILRHIQPCEGSQIIPRRMDIAYRPVLLSPLFWRIRRKISAKS